MSRPPLARRLAPLLFALCSTLSSTLVHAGGIDHRINFDNSGIWSRSNQFVVQDGLPVIILATALWQGDDNRLGHTAWQSVDAQLLGAVTATGMKLIFSRSRPNQGNDPNKFFQGSGNRSFPSGEVMESTTAVVPFIFEYGREEPAVWALGLIPIYTGVARLKSQAHWQTDVLTSLALGTAIGYYTHSRANGLTVSVLPKGITIGWKKSF